MYRRKKIADDLLKDAAEVFAYTANSLAAGDAIREATSPAIRTSVVCCSSVASSAVISRPSGNFDSAIRQALQGVSEDALTALDNTSKWLATAVKRWVRQHQDVALQALNRMAGEIAQMQAIPQR